MQTSDELVGEHLQLKGSMKKAYLDIETNYVGPYSDERLFRDYKNHQLVVIGIRTVTSSHDSFVQLIDKDATKSNLLSALKGVECIVTYNGRSFPDRIHRRVGFDFPVISAQLGLTLDEKFEHVDLVPVCWQAGLYGGQKKVEELLGLMRELPGKDGAWANQAWKNYLKTGKKTILDELLAYNREDVFMLQRIEQKLCKS